METLHKKSPCTADCPNRWAECHVDCKPYLEYEAQQRKKYDQKAKAMDAYWDGMTAGKSRMIKVSKRARKHSMRG